MSALTKACTVKGCCIEEIMLTTSVAAAATAFPLITVAQEVCRTAYWLPSSLVRIASDIWSHVQSKPRIPTWDIQTTIIIGFMQAFRSNSTSCSIAYWRLCTDSARIFGLIKAASIEPISVPIRSRGLYGILKKMDEEEKGDRTLYAEWVSAILPNISNYYGTENEKVVLYFHGGGYCMMSAQTHRLLTTKISQATGRRVLAVNYRLAPETKFPGALYDAVQTFLWLISKEGGFKAENISVMGDSAGGGLCLSSMLYLRDHGLPLPESAVLLSPFVDLTYSYSSWDDCVMYDYLAPRPNHELTVNPLVLYLESPDFATHPYVSPIYADHFDHLPPILIQSGGCESLRDEIVALENKISKSKATKVRHEVYKDMMHVFQAFPFAKSAEAIENIGQWTRINFSK